MKYICDYQTGIQTDLISGEKIKMDIPQSNVLIYHTENGTELLQDLVERNQKLNFILV